LLVIFCVGKNAAAPGTLILKIRGIGRKIIPNYCSRCSTIEIIKLETFVPADNVHSERYIGHMRASFLENLSDE
jgi:hypothetical protein